MQLRHSLLASSLLFCTVTASCIHDPSLFRRQAQGTAVPIAQYGYNELQGPLNWEALNPNNSDCALSSIQSPINLNASIPLATVLPSISIPDVASATQNNIGTHVEVITNGTATLGSRKYNFFQFHFHTPSEHRVRDEYFPIEMHVVWLDAATTSPSIGDFLVNAVFFEISTNNQTLPLLNGVTQNIQSIAQPGTTTKTGPLAFKGLVDHITTKPAFEYTGSITTPPCTHGLKFFVTQEPLPINPTNFLALKNVIKFNSRYTQNTVGAPNLLLVATDRLQGSLKAGGSGNSTSTGNTKKSASVASIAQVPTPIRLGFALLLLLII